MRLLRYRRNTEAETQWGWLNDDRVGALSGPPFEAYRREKATIPLEQVQLESPIIPGKIICVGRNYAAHAEEHGSDVPELPLLFFKPTSAVIGPGGPIWLPPQSQLVEHEAELALIIGQRARWIEADQAADFILGYTCGNDVTARDLQRQDDQWTRAKGFDSFCPLGPWIETELDPADVLVSCTVNGQPRQMASTRDMAFPARQLVAFISSVMTLEPGDVIMTGTPSGVGPLNPGDEVSVEVEGIGTLTNPVTEDPHAPQSA